MSQERTQSCRDCGAEFFYSPFFGLGGREVFAPVLCEPCERARIELDRKRESDDRATAKKAEWLAMCPPLYRETDESRLPEVLRHAIDSWKFGPVGLGIVGQAGTCKTRGGFLLLRKAHDAGLRCHAVSSTDFARACTMQFSDGGDRQYAATEIKACRVASVLMFDDIGKAKFTPRHEAELFDLLEYRTAHSKPTIWTANAGGAALGAMFGDDRRDPIIRRLVEFSKIVSIK